MEVCVNNINESNLVVPGNNIYKLEAQDSEATDAYKCTQNTIVMINPEN